MDLETLGSHRSTYDAVFQHPVARNLEWMDLRALLGSIAEVAELGSGALKFTRNGQTLVVPFMPDVDTNTPLHRVGASYGVLKLVGDRPHWSHNGR